MSLRELDLQLREDLVVHGQAAFEVDDAGMPLRRIPPDELVFRRDVKAWFHQTPHVLVPLRPAQVRSADRSLS